MRRRFDLWILLAVVLAALLRIPSLTASLTSEDALLANATWRLASETGWPDRSVPPGLPLLAAMSAAAGVSPTWALRFTGAALAVLLVPLAAALARRMGAGRRSRRRVAGLVAVHPVLVGFVGGPVVGTAALLLPLGLLLLLGLASSGRRRRRVALVGCALLPLVHAAGIFFGACLLVGGLTRQRETRLTLLCVLLFAGALVLTWPAWGGGAVAPGSVAVLLAIGLPAALVFSGVPGLPRGLVHWLRASRPGDVVTRWWGIASVLVLGWWIAGSPLQRPGWRYEALDLAVILLPLAIVLGVRGIAGFGPRWARRLMVASLLTGLAGSVFLAVGATKDLMRESARSPAGRLLARDRAVARALDVVPRGGFILLEFDEDSVGVHASVADTQPAARWRFMRRRPAVEGPAAGDPRGLGTFPADDYDPSLPGFVAVRRAPVWGEEVPVQQWKPVVVYGRAARFRQQAPLQVGPYWIVRLARDP